MFLCCVQDFLQIELKETQDKLQQTLFLLESKDNRMEAVTKEMEEERQQAVVYFNALEVSRSKSRKFKQVSAVAAILPSHMDG